ncbi:hypothetical protein [Candidatus Formimonas warabiya]|uniref:Copper amine oxidase-like N-terminal domain-containing protein n=1 Tax=Formimonas warabiya TaxID=1761012 RepID=A0A3G1KUN5_FORW1|nr:hypothetical protein [Candidatus Formimonas warabiya]ATW26188.1 hypothetical protein DCMF_16700 [Candidatus Formimonas warabiya]
MKYMKKFIVVIVVLISITYQFNIIAQEASEEKSVLLKINQYYVLYAYPISPFINDKGVLMLPLRTFTELLGGKITYVPDEHQVDIVFLDRNVIFDLTKEKFYIEAGKIFISAREFFEKFEICFKWDQTNSLVEVSDDRLMKHPLIEAFEGGDVYSDGNNVINNKAFDLISFSIANDTKEPYLKRLTIKAKNISGLDIPEGMEDIHPIFLYNDNTFESESDIRSTRQRQAFNPDQIRTNTYLFGSDENLLAILALGRTIDTRN